MLVFFREECISVVNYYVEEINVWDLQEHAELDYKLRFCRCRGCVAELHRETTDYYTTSFADSRRGKSGMVGFGTISMVYHKFVNYAKVCFALRAAWRI